MRKDDFFIPKILNLDQVRKNVVESMKKEKEEAEKKAKEIQESTSFSQMSEMEKHKHVLNKKASGQKFTEEEDTFWKDELNDWREESRSNY